MIIQRPRSEQGLYLALKILRVTPQVEASRGRAGVGLRSFSQDLGNS